MLIRSVLELQEAWLCRGLPRRDPQAPWAGVEGRDRGSSCPTHPPSFAS